MARELIHEKPLMVRLEPTLKRRLKRAAAELDTDMSKLTREALEEYLDRIERDGRGRRIVERLTGSAGPGLTTDEIMALTRGE